MTLFPSLRSLVLVAVIAAAAWLAAPSAHADSPVNGQSLYTTHCASCHGASPLTSNTAKIYMGRNARGVIDAAITNVGAMKSLRSAFPAGGTALADLAAYLGNTPTALTFASTPVGTTSAAQTVTVYASLKTGNSIAGLSVTTSGDFARTGGTCGTAVATGSNCTIQVAFTPTAGGTRSGTLSITHGNTLTPITIALGGSGSGGAAPAPSAAISPASLSFPSTAIGVTSAALNVTVANTGAAPLNLSSLALTNSADFVIAGGTCAAGGSVAAGQSCTVSVAFRPSAGATGSRSGTLTIAHDAAGSPGTVALAGSASAAPAPVASMTAALNFGSVNVGSTGSPQSATLSNTGPAPLSLGTVSTGGSSDFTVTGGTCASGASVAPGASCTVSVSFSPTAAGARSGTLTVTHNAAGGQSTTSLGGTGVALTPVAGVSPTTLSFSQAVGTTSTSQTVTVSNTGTAPLVLGALTFGGAQAADYQTASGTTCVAGGSVAAGSSCVIKVAFSPSATGARNATLSIAHNVGGSPSMVSLNGTGTATAQPTLAVDATSLNFAARVVGTTSGPQTVTLTNTGTATLNLTGLALTGTAAGDFTRGGTCTAPGTVAVGAACTVTITFTPGAVGSRTATLSIASDASNGTAAVSLAGSGLAAPAPALSLNPGAIAFGNQTVGQTSAARNVTLTNTGTAALALSSITASSGFGVSHNCGTSVAAGASCTLQVTFAPTAAGAASGSISVASNAAGSPHAVILSGSGVAASPVLAWTPATTSVAFGSVAVGGTPATQSLTLVNNGPGSATIIQVTIAGTNAADFAPTGGTCTPGAALAQGGTCTLGLSFQPAGVGARSATLQLTTSGTNPASVSLSGRGTAAAQPAITLVPAAVRFNVAATATTVAPQLLTLQSTGSAVLRVSGMRVASGPFTLEAAAANACPPAPFDLMPGQSCGMSVGWSSGSASSDAGAIEIDTNASATPVRVDVVAVRQSSVDDAGDGAAAGCSIARADAPFDPGLWGLVVAAAAALALRCRRNRPASRLPSCPEPRTETLEP